jgi:hypothetical protein
VAVDVKGRLGGAGRGCPGRELAQMSAAWVDTRDNPGMANWKLGSEDVDGAVVLVNFATMAYRAAFTARLCPPASARGAAAAC